MASFIDTIKAIITRIIFSAHGVIAIYRVVTIKNDPWYWYLSTTILILGFEGVFTLAIKKTQEWKWFCPSIFLYLASVCPSIWLIELDKLDTRLAKKESMELMSSEATTTEILDTFSTSLSPSLAAIGGEDNADQEAVISNSSSNVDLGVLKDVGIPLDLENIAIPVDTDTLVVIIEQFLMLILIIGRWMLPKGDLTRDQLAQLLLVCIGTAADIIEFFDSFKVNTNKVLCIMVLTIWSWSLLQFTVLLTPSKNPPPKIENPTKLQRAKEICCSIDVWEILLNIILQDAPFFVFRLLLITYYELISYMNIFFTCKNTLVITLQFYRLMVVQLEKREALANEQKMRAKKKADKVKATNSNQVSSSRSSRRIVVDDVADRQRKSRHRSSSGRKSRRTRHHHASRDRTSNHGRLQSARTFSTEESCQSPRCHCGDRQVSVANPVPQRSSSSSNSRARPVRDPPTAQIKPRTAQERRKSLLRERSVIQEDEIVQVEVVHESAQRQPLTSDGDDTLNNIRVPSLENDEEANIERSVPPIGKLRNTEDDDGDVEESVPLLQRNSANMTSNDCPSINRGSSLESRTTASMSGTSSENSGRNHGGATRTAGRPCRIRAERGDIASLIIECEDGQDSETTFEDIIYCNHPAERRSLLSGIMSPFSTTSSTTSSSSFVSSDTFSTSTASSSSRIARELFLKRKRQALRDELAERI